MNLGGPFKGLALIAGLPYATGNQSGANQGSGHFVAFYQFNDNSAHLPALPIEGPYDTPYGSGRKTAEYTVKVLATKYLGVSDQAPRLHVNLIWTHRTQPGEKHADRPAVSAGVGVGIAQQSPDYRFIFALQKSFTVF